MYIPIYHLEIESKTYIVVPKNRKECPEFYVREFGRLDREYLAEKMCIEAPNYTYLFVVNESKSPPGTNIYRRYASRQMEWQCFIPKQKPFVECASCSRELKRAIWTDSPAMFGGEVITVFPSDVSHSDNYEALEDLSVIAVTHELTPAWIGSTFVNLFPKLEFMSLPEKIYILETEQNVFLVLIEHRVYALQYENFLKFLKLIGFTYGWNDPLEKMLEKIVREQPVDENLVLAT